MGVHREVGEMVLEEIRKGNTLLLMRVSAGNHRVAFGADKTDDGDCGSRDGNGSGDTAHGNGRAEDNIVPQCGKSLVRNKTVQLIAGCEKSIYSGDVKSAA